MVATVRLWENEQKVITQPIERKRDVTAIFFPACDGGKIVTYKIQVFNADGEEVTKWEHHFWAELIEIGDNSSSAQWMSDSVSSHPIQESVMETP